MTTKRVSGKLILTNKALAYMRWADGLIHAGKDPEETAAMDIWDAAWEASKIEALQADRTELLNEDREV